MNGGCLLEVVPLEKTEPDGLRNGALLPDQLGHQHAARRDDIRDLGGSRGACRDARRIEKDRVQVSDVVVSDRSAQRLAHRRRKVEAPQRRCEVADLHPVHLDRHIERNAGDVVAVDIRGHDGDFVAARDHKRFRFTAIQSPYGTRLARAFGVDPQDPDTNAVIHGGIAYFKSDAALTVLSHLPGWSFARSDG